MMAEPKRELISQRVKAIPPWPIMGYDFNTVQHQKNNKRYLLELLAETNTNKDEGGKK